MEVDGKSNPKIQSIHLERFPVHKARFSVDGEQVVATSFRNKLFYLYDMMAGKIVPVHYVRGERGGKGGVGVGGGIGRGEEREVWGGGGGGRVERAEGAGGRGVE